MTQDPAQLARRGRPQAAMTMPDGTPVYVMPPQGRVQDTPAGRRAIRRAGKGLTGPRPKKIP